jgi:hypothetical protein
MGLPVSADLRFQDALDQMALWGFKIALAGDRVRLVFDNEQLVPQWLEAETPTAAWDRLRARGFLA